MAFNHDGTKIVSGSNDKTIKVWDAGAPSAGTPPPDDPIDTPAPPNAESLNELSKVENADPDAIMSVQFDPDGKTIVSGGASGTLKVWDAINFRPHMESEWEQFNKTIEAEDSDEEDEVEEWWRNKVTGHEQATKPSGGAPLGH